MQEPAPTGESFPERKQPTRNQGKLGTLISKKLLPENVQISFREIVYKNSLVALT